MAFPSLQQEGVSDVKSVWHYIRGNGSGVRGESTLHAQAAQLEVDLKKDENLDLMPHPHCFHSQWSQKHFSFQEIRKSWRNKSRAARAKGEKRIRKKKGKKIRQKYIGNQVKGNCKDKKEKVCVTQIDPHAMKKDVVTLSEKHFSGIRFVVDLVFANHEKQKKKCICQIETDSLKILE